jgi:hypothetical protein
MEWKQGAHVFAIKLFTCAATRLPTLHPYAYLAGIEAANGIEHRMASGPRLLHAANY